MYDYCQFYLSKHLPAALRQERSSILSLEKDELYKIINQSMEYLVFDYSDLELVLELAAELWSDGDLI